MVWFISFIILLNSNLSSKINITDIVNALNNTSTNKPLSAAQGKVLKDSLNTKGNPLIFGSKNGGHYIRIPDIKMQICFGVVKVSATLTSLGTGFAGDSSLSNNVFAMPFATVLSCTITNNSLNWVWVLSKATSQSAITGITLGYFTAYENAKFELDYLAIGTC